MSPRTEAERPAPPDRERVRAVRKALLDHYDRTARELPWRGESDPYRVWVSEVMLQQTRVETVMGYYDRWLERFPDVESLASADLDEVLLAWEGLGYYRRARNLHAGARVVRESFGGRVPSTYEELRSLPGLGDYAAGAVASIAFGRAVPAVDGNVRRVFARLFDVAEPGAAWLRSMGQVLVDPDRPGDWNQALMDLGATVCVPGTPRCDACPLAQWCAARAAGTQEDRPAPPKRKSVPAATFVTAVVADADGRVLVARRPADGLLGGMWSFPDTEVEGHPDADEVVAAARAVAADLGVALDGNGADTPMSAVRHRFSHLDATYRPVLLRGGGPAGEDRRWVDPGAPGVALPVAQQKMAAAAADALAPGGGR